VNEKRAENESVSAVLYGATPLACLAVGPARKHSRSRRYLSAISETAMNHTPHPRNESRTVAPTTFVMSATS